MKMTVIAAALALASAGNVLAQTCDNPIPLQSNQQVAGDTCAGSNSLPGYGGTTSPQNEIVYSFVAQGASGDYTLEQTGAAFGATMFLLPSPCASGTDPMSFGDFNNAMPNNNLAGGGTPLVDGQTYYVIVTADPGGPANACGPYNLVPPTLPVELQNFSVE